MAYRVQAAFGALAILSTRLLINSMCVICANNGEISSAL
jgi:hypothetical protein